MRKNYFLSLFLLITAFWNVEAKDGSKSTNSTRNSETAIFLPLNNPTGLAGAAVGGNSTRINLTWNDNSLDEAEFEVAYSPLASGYQTVLTGVPNSAPIAGYQLTNLLPGTQYYVWVRAIKTGVDVPTCTAVANMPTNPAPTGKSVSCWAGPLLISTNPGLPQSPTGAYASIVSQRSITLNWTDNSTNESSFEISRAIDGGAFSPLATINGVSGTGNRTYVDNTVFPTGRYSYQVFAINNTGYSPLSTTTAIYRTPNDPPIAPSDLALQDNALGLDFIKIYWINNDFKVDAFVIEYSFDQANWITLDEISPNDPGYVANNLLEGKLYYFRVKAKNDGGSSGYSNVLGASTLKRVAPNPSFNLEAKTISTTQIDLKWNLGVEDNVTNNRVSQEIYRSSLSGTDGFMRIVTLGNYESTYSDTTGTPKTKYWYKIISVNYQGQSPFSNIAVATTLGPPFAPSDLKTVLANDALGNTIIKATWTDNSDDEWGFALERSADNTFATGVLRADLDSNTVAATSIPIEEGLTYYFRIKASNKYGDSKYSATSEVNTIVTLAPNAPYDLKGTATASSVTLNWGDDSNKEDAFEIERSIDSTSFVKIAETGRNLTTYTDTTVSEKTKYYYRVRAANIKGSSDYTNVVMLTTSAKTSASIGLADLDVFQVFPNPTADAVKVRVSDSMLNETGEIIITDRMNRVVSKTILNSNQSEYQLDLSNYTEGSYTISLRTATQQITKRVYKF
jgi:hypothetical protein